MHLVLSFLFLIGSAGLGGGFSGPTASRVENRDKDDTYVGTLNDSFKFSATATGTRLRPIAGMI